MGRPNHKTVQIKTVKMLLQKLMMPEMTLKKRNQLLKTPPRTKQKLRKLKSQQMKHKARKRAKMLPWTKRKLLTSLREIPKMLGKMAHRRTMEQMRMALVKKMMLEKPKTNQLRPLKKKRQNKKLQQKKTRKKLMLAKPKTNQLRVKRRMKPNLTMQVTKLEKVGMTTEPRKMRQMKKKHLTMLLSPNESHNRIDVTYTATLLTNLKVISLCLSELIYCITLR